MFDPAEWARKGARPPEEKPTSRTRVHRAQEEGEDAEKARKEIVEERARSFYYAAGQVAADVGAALDCAHRLIVRVLEGVLLRGFDPSKGTLLGWLIVAARHDLLNERRDLHSDLVRRLGGYDPAVREEDPSASLIAREVATAVQEARRETERRLEGKHGREVFLLWIDDPAGGEYGWYKKVAGILGISVPALRDRLEKVLDIFEEELRRRGLGE